MFNRQFCIDCNFEQCKDSEKVRNVQVFDLLFSQN
nr:MAG TPA: hypothetical protein [Caudoviricetes sp.]